MKDTTSKILFSLAETDKSIEEAAAQRDQLERKMRSLAEDIQVSREQLVNSELQHREAQNRLALEEQRLREEEQKIVERRKQLTALGGVRSAKLIEREIDIASRSLESLEHNVSEATALTESLESQVKMLQEKVEQLERERENEAPGAEKALQEIGAKLADLQKEHDSLIDRIDERLRNLYRKVNTRYPGEAVALAKNGACRSCYRALPAQMYNQVMAGNRLIQCPGCSRILVYGNNENNS